MNKKITLLLGAAIMALSAGAAEAVSSYSGYLNVDMGGEPLTYNGAATVTITDHGDGVCDFLLPDLTLAGLGSLGDISVPACSVETDTEGTSTYAGHVESLSLALYGNPIVAGVDIAGTITADGVVDVTVPVIWYMDNDCTNKSEDNMVPINVKFTSERSNYASVNGYCAVVSTSDNTNIYSHNPAKFDVFYTQDEVGETIVNLGINGVKGVDGEEMVITGATVAKDETTGVLTFTGSSLSSNAGVVNISNAVVKPATNEADCVFTLDNGNTVIFSNIDNWATSKNFSGFLNVDMGGEPLTYNGAATVTITDHGDGVCDFLLPDLTLAGLGSLGDISVPACSVETDTEGTSTYAGHVESLSLALYGNPIVAGVDIAGTITADGVVDVTVPVIWYMDNDCTNKSEDNMVPINVKFTSERSNYASFEGLYAVAPTEDHNAPIVYRQPAQLDLFLTQDEVGNPVYNLGVNGIQYADGTEAVTDFVVSGVEVEKNETTGDFTFAGTGLTSNVGTVAVAGSAAAASENYEVVFTVDGVRDIIFQDKVKGDVKALNAVKADIYAVKGAIVVNGFDGKVTVIALDAKTIAVAKGDASIAVAPGAYIVRAGNTVKKVIVK